MALSTIEIIGITIVSIALAAATVVICLRCCNSMATLAEDANEASKVKRAKAFARNVGANVRASFRKARNSFRNRGWRKTEPNKSRRQNVPTVAASVDINRSQLHPSYLKGNSNSNRGFVPDYDPNERHPPTSIPVKSNVKDVKPRVGKDPLPLPPPQAPPQPPPPPPPPPPYTPPKAKPEPRREPTSPAQSDAKTQNKPLCPSPNTIHRQISQLRPATTRDFEPNSSRRNENKPQEAKSPMLKSEKATHVSNAQPKSKESPLNKRKNTKSEGMTQIDKPRQDNSHSQIDNDDCGCKSVRPDNSSSREKNWGLNNNPSREWPLLCPTQPGVEPRDPMSQRKYYEEHQGYGEKYAPGYWPDQTRYMYPAVQRPGWDSRGGPRGAQYLSEYGPEPAGRSDASRTGRDPYRYPSRVDPRGARELQMGGAGIPVKQQQLQQPYMYNKQNHYPPEYHPNPYNQRPYLNPYHRDYPPQVSDHWGHRDPRQGVIPDPRLGYNARLQRPAAAAGRTDKREHRSRDHKPMRQFQPRSNETPRYDPGRSYREAGDPHYRGLPDWNSVRAATCTTSDTYV